MSEINWQTIGVLFSLLTIFSAVLLLAVKLIFESYRKHVDLKFDSLDSALQMGRKEWQQLEREFLQFQAKMPEHYVMRDDWIRFSAVIDAKQDALHARVSETNEKLQRLLERNNTNE